MAIDWISDYIACIIIIRFATIILFRYVLSGLQRALLLTSSISATQAVSALTTDFDALPSQGGVECVSPVLFCNANA